MKPASLLAAVLLFAFLPLSAEDKKPDGERSTRPSRPSSTPPARIFEEAKGEFEKANEKVKAAAARTPRVPGAPT